MVHCSAGVGRTGVIIAVDIGLQCLLNGDKRVDIMRTVSSMRQDRAGMVQTKEQYRFVHQVGRLAALIMHNHNFQITWWLEL